MKGFSMKKKIIVSFFMVPLFMVTVQLMATQELSPQDEAFIEKYDAPQRIYDALDQYTDTFHVVIKECEEMVECRLVEGRKRYLVWEFENLPGYLVKYGLSRIRGREIIKQCIEEHNLTCLTVPQKYIYHIQGKGQELTKSNYFVIVENMYAREPKMFSFEEVQQICILLRETGFLDFVTQNVLRLDNNQIAFIDTEDGFDKIKNYRGLCRIITHNHMISLDSFSKGALKYLFLQLLECRPQDNSEYREMYESIHKALSLLKRRNKLPGWDCLTYFEETFPKPD